VKRRTVLIIFLFLLFQVLFTGRQKARIQTVARRSVIAIGLLPWLYRGCDKACGPSRPKLWTKGRNHNILCMANSLDCPLRA